MTSQRGLFDDCSGNLSLTQGFIYFCHWCAFSWISPTVILSEALDEQMVTKIETIIGMTSCILNMVMCTSIYIFRIVSHIFFVSWVTFSSSVSLFCPICCFPLVEVWVKCVCVCPSCDGLLTCPVSGVLLSPSDCLNRPSSACDHAVRCCLFSHWCVRLTLTSPVSVIKGATGFKYDPRACISVDGEWKLI